MQSQPGKRPLAAWCFSVVVVRRGDRFLLVQERKHGQRWYLPAGRVEPGEGFAEAAVRETLEESCVPIRLLGLIRLDTSHKQTGLRLRAVFYGEPAGDTPPKSVADEHTLQAKWFSLDEIAGLPLRGADAAQLAEYVANGKTIHPLEIFGQEGSPYGVGGAPIGT